MDKQILRKQAGAIRNSISKALILSRSAKISSKFRKIFLPSLKNIKCAMVYMSTQSEVKTSGIIRLLSDKGIKIFVPCLSGGKIIPSLYTMGCAVTRGAYNIKEPVMKNKPSAKNCINLVLIPGLAFDQKGNRLGFGKGFFDRYLKQLPSSAVKTALAFEMQIVKSVPSKRHDIKMDYIITEDRIINCGGKK